ncbi:NADPH-dependent aldehyde reductase-like protein, chloroplastic [Aristolochia californica]|uniref:NADPH-dependent aldehyde reductase-like protein, chloroplastic n=1 Tax=Aristolochia californica TaxID=171875 RepID=UPI0035E0ABE0
MDQSPSTLPLAGRIAIVTGSSGGIGREVALHLSSLGAKLVLADIHPAERTHPLLSVPSQATAIKTDITKPHDVKAMFDHAERTFGRPVHILVHCAGVASSTYPSLADTSVVEWEKLFEVNAKGTFLCCREAAGRLVRGGGGRIIAFSSSTAATARPGYGAYASTKAAVETMVRVLAKEMKGTRITANCVAPGPVATEMFFAGKSEEVVKQNAEENPLSRLGEPIDVAAVVGFLAGDSGEWINGQVIRVNGGLV